jgi:hypothetical protein
MHMCVCLCAMNIYTLYYLVYIYIYCTITLQFYTIHSTSLAPMSSNVYQIQLPTSQYQVRCGCVCWCICVCVWKDLVYWCVCILCIFLYSQGLLAEDCTFLHIESTAVVINGAEDDPLKGNHTLFILTSFAIIRSQTIFVFLFSHTPHAANLNINSLVYDMVPPHDTVLVSWTHSTDSDSLSTSTPALAEEKEEEEEEEEESVTVFGGADDEGTHVCVCVCMSGVYVFIRLHINRRAYT